jgi:GT2 family glycosyltransferase
MNPAVIIPSAKVANLVPCIQAVRHHETELPVIVVGDGMTVLGLGTKIAFVQGKKPFIFSRNVNAGIRAAIEDYGSRDFILLNDDALLQTPGGFTALAEDAFDRADYGIISAVTNAAGNPNQYSRGSGFRDEHKMLCFVCVLITWEAICTAGWLDERFTAYGWEDNDYCRRVREAGLKLGVSERCFVDHLSLRSTFRGDPRAAADITAGAEIYRAKWGDLA